MVPRGAWGRAAAVGAVALCGCTFANTEPPPGDLTAFDAFGALAEVGRFAGPGARLVRVKALHVRSSGTQDLTAKYFGPGGAADTYEFLVPVQAPVDESLPLGARPAPRSVVQVDVWIYKPHWETLSSSDRRGTSYSWKKHRGMMRFEHRAPLLSSPAPVRPPACSLARLWALARKRGAPANAVATIEYDDTGYSFRIDGTKVDLRFDQQCRPKS